MNFLGDLDGLSWVALIATLILCVCLIALVLWNKRNGWAIDVSKLLAFMAAVAFMCLVGAIASHSPYDGIPRKTVEGSAHIVHVSHGHRSTTYFICADTCSATGGYALQLDERAGDALSREPKGTRYRFTYPDKVSGGVMNGVSLVVESIAEEDSGRIIYELDLRTHPFRIASYIGDILLLIFAAVVASRLAPMRKRGRFRRRGL